MSGSSHGSFNSSIIDSSDAAVGIGAKFNNLSDGVYACKGRLHSAFSGAMPGILKPLRRRPTCLIVGNSIAGQSNRLMVEAPTTTTTAAVKRGATRIPVAATTSFVIASNALTVGTRYKILTVSTANYTLAGALTNTVGEVFTATSATAAGAGGTVIQIDVAINIPSATFHITQIVALDSTNLEIATPLPRAIISGATVLRLTNKMPKVRSQMGFQASMLALSGMPWDILPGIGYSGAMAKDVVPDLKAYVDWYRPDYVMLNLFENDVVQTTPNIAEMKQYATAAINICLAGGALPILFSCVPRGSVTTALQIAAWDEMLNFTMYQTPTIVTPVDVSTPWLDTAQPTLRTPISGWTDGTHPSPNYWTTIAQLILPQLKKLLCIMDSHVPIALAFTDMSGTGGTTSGAGTTSGTVAAGLQIITPTSCTTVCSKTASGKQRLVYACATTANISTHQLTVASFSYTTNPSTLGGQWVKGSVRFKVNSLTSISIIQPGLLMGDGNSQLEHTCNEVSATAQDPSIIGKELTYETAAVRVMDAVSNLKIQLNIRPVTGAIDAAIDIELIEMCLLPATGEIGDTAY